MFAQTVISQELFVCGPTVETYFIFIKKQNDGQQLEGLLKLTLFYHLIEGSHIHINELADC